MQPIHALHTIAGLHPRFGGPSRVMVDLADALAQQEGLNVTLLTQADSGAPILENACPRVKRRVVADRSRLARNFSVAVSQSLRQLMDEDRPAIVHSHGLWLPVNHHSAAASRRYGVPLVVQPHGMLEPWSLAHKAMKKQLAMALFQRRDLRSAKLFVATSGAEFDSIRRLGFSQPVAIIPNGIVPPVYEAVLLQPAAASSPKKNVLFLSRIHPVKGLLNLVKAWSSLSNGGWKLRIAGPDEGGHLAEVLALVEQLQLHDSVEYVGEADSARKAALYKDAALLVLPTLSENFGVVVAEALSYGVPVITTRGAPWADLVTYGCGWWVEQGVQPLAEALGAAMSMDDAELIAMGARGREYVRRYDWTNLAGNLADTYRWLLGVGSKPACVQEG